MAGPPSQTEESPAADGSSRAEQSVQAFRDALEKSITISRERLQEVLDDAVRRGRMTRADAEEMVGRLTTRGREQAEELLSQAESLLGQVGGRAEQARKRAVAAADQPLARVDRVKRGARVPGFPITAYDQLSIRQIDRRLQELSRQELRKVRDYERGNKARKGLLRALDRKLQD
jgi:polyhydroxyalkanoate synthesis regulator phasin